MGTTRYILRHPHGRLTTAASQSRRDRRLGQCFSNFSGLSPQQWGSAKPQTTDRNLVPEILLLSATGPHRSDKNKKKVWFSLLAGKFSWELPPTNLGITGLDNYPLESFHRIAIVVRPP